eukprot:TRINITY_DN10194_c0_g1_i1.p1 TRINITY_DN10194_c0_g1~~TRINITY_DN10194_c0_g1_i1.p1  ORF type:complete len:338 (+),score=34.01 TRINITY_DN10194_c0_g1_i1:1-1014(+)
MKVIAGLFLLIGVLLSPVCAETKPLVVGQQESTSVSSKSYEYFTLTVEEMPPLSEAEPIVLRLLVNIQADSPTNSTEGFAVVVSPTGPSFPTIAKSSFNDTVPDVFDAPEAGPNVRWQQFQVIVENPTDTSFFVGVYNPGLTAVSATVLAHYSYDRVLRIGAPEIAVTVRSSDAVTFFKVLKDDLASAFRGSNKGYLLFSAATPDHVSSFVRRDKFASIYVHDSVGTIRPDPVKGGNIVEILIPNLGTESDIHITVRRDDVGGPNSVIVAEVDQLINSNYGGSSLSPGWIALIVLLSIVVVLLAARFAYSWSRDKSTGSQVDNSALYDRLPVDSQQP